MIHKSSEQLLLFSGEDHELQFDRGEVMTEIDYTFKDSDHRILHDDGKQKSHGKKTENTSLSNSSRSAAAPKEEGSFIKKGTKTISYFA